MNQSAAVDEDTARVQKAVTAVRAWESLTETPQAPERGSDLAADDMVFPPLPTSTVAWFAITSAIDHLSLGADLLQADDVKVLRPQAFHSLTRSALLGAAQALWVLAGRPDERAMRSLLIVEDEASMQRKYIRAYLHDPTISNDVSADFLEQLREQDTKLTDRITAVRRELRTRGHKGGFQSTQMITDVAAHMAPRDPWLRRALMDQWQRGSAAAHSRMWTLHFREVEDSPLPEGGAIRRCTSTSTDIAQAYGSPTLVLSEALTLWNERRRRPVRIPPLVTMPLPRPTLH